MGSVQVENKQKLRKQYIRNFPRDDCNTSLVIILTTITRQRERP